MRQVVRKLAGVAVVAVLVALSFPGVKAVRADALSTPAASADGPMCRAGAPLADPAVIDDVARTIRLQAAAQGAQPQLRVLNGRGYSYRPADGGVSLSALAREIAVQRREGHPAQ
jgi:hypothetical protein